MTSSFPMSLSEVLARLARVVVVATECEAILDRRFENGEIRSGDIENPARCKIDEDGAITLNLDQLTQWD